MDSGNPRLAMRLLGRGSGMRTCERMATVQLWAMGSFSPHDITALPSTRGLRAILAENDRDFELWRRCLRLIDLLREIFAAEMSHELRGGLRLAKCLNEAQSLPTLDTELLAIAAVAKCAAVADAASVYEEAKLAYVKKCQQLSGGRSNDLYMLFSSQDADKRLSQAYFSVAAQMKRMAGVTSALAGNAITGWIKQVFATSAEQIEDIKQKQAKQYQGTMTEFFSHAKGVLLKASQIIEFVEFAFPRAGNPDLQVVRRQQSTPMDPKISKEVIEREFKRPVQEVFAGWHDLPLAAASIGQVHRARTPDGNIVAVKIKFPGIDRMMRNQLKYLQIVAPFLEVLYPGVAIRASLKAMSAIIMKELDFALETEHQERFCEAVKSLTDVKVPQIYRHLCRPGIITMDLIEGTRFWEFAYSASQEQKNLAGERIFRGLMHALFFGNVMHSDPHPGNFLFLEDSVGIIDFGSATTKVKHWQKFVRSMVSAVRSGDDDALLHALEEIGFLRKQARSALETASIVEHFRHNYIPFAIQEPFKFDRNFTQVNYHGVHRLISHLQLPSEAVEPLRFMVGLVSTLTALDCEGRFAEILDEILSGSFVADLETAV
jgi:predicted unusual protein kinase regulating ubiquinone biosynthesis (AarF/ABC1/UbiB family)